MRHASTIPGHGRRSKRLAIVGAGKRWNISRRCRSDRHAARHPNQRRQPRHHPSRRDLQRPRRDHHRPAMQTSTLASQPTSTARNEPRADRHQRTPQPTPSTTSPPTKTASRPPQPAPSSSKPHRSSLRITHRRRHQQTTIRRRRPPQPRHPRNPNPPVDVTRLQHARGFRTPITIAPRNHRVSRAASPCVWGAGE